MKYVKQFSIILESPFWQSFWIDRGHRRIAHLCGSPSNPIALERKAGYRRALSESGIPFDPRLTASGDFTPASGYEAMKRLLGRTSDFSAVFAANDQMAVGAVKALVSQGIAVPGDVAVIGIDNLNVSSMIQPALSTVNVPTFQMGHLAAQTVIDARNPQACPQSHPLPCSLVVRRSTDPFAAAEWELFGW